MTSVHQEDLNPMPTTLVQPAKLPSVYEIHDPIYGTVLIDSACAIEIIHLPEFTRLKNVLQHGITALIGLLPRPHVNRFDHSVGAMILVKHVGGSEEAQLAALLHDVSHTALSHVVDFAFGYVVHEVEKAEFLATTYIPEVLRKHGFDPERISKEELFPLLELPSPQICADRLDYALRDSVSFGYLKLEDAQEIFRATISVNEQMVLNSTRAARLLGEAYLMSDQNVWADGTQAYLYKLAAEAIKLSIKEGSIVKESLWSCGDQEFWDQLVRNASPEVTKIVARINPQCMLDEVNVDRLIKGSRGCSDDAIALEDASELCTFKLRVRTIDPPVYTSKGVEPLSILEPGFGRRRADYIHSRDSPITFRVKYVSDPNPVVIPKPVL